MQQLMINDEVYKDILSKAEKVMDMLFTDHTKFSSYHVGTVFSDTIVPQLIVDHIVVSDLIEEDMAEITVPQITSKIFINITNIENSKPEDIRNGIIFSVESL